MHFFKKAYQLYSHTKVESTNTIASQLYEPGKVLPIVVANQQTGGRGSHGKSWHSPSGNLYLSFVIDDDLTPLQTRQLSLLTGLALYNVLKSIFAGENFLCKWPNDLLLNDKKIAGILIEKAFYIDHPYFVVGMGLNTVESYPSSVFPSTSLRQEHLPLNGNILSNEWLAEQILGQLSDIYAHWIQQGFEDWQHIWNKCCYGWGKEIQLEDGKALIKGIFQGIDTQGNITMENHDGVHSLARGTFTYDDKKVKA